MAGWVAVSRGLWDHDFFKDGEMSEREAWMWMVAKAAYADTSHRVAGKDIAVPRGSFVVTLRELQSTFRWASDTRVRNFLKRLKNERMARWEIVGRKNAPKTHVTICNYERFQAAERTTERTEKRTENAPTNAVKKQDKQINNTLSHERGARVTPESFDEFWNQYPHRGGAKKGRKPALAKYIAAIKSGASEHEIIQGALRYATDRQAVSGYAKDPATWINQRGWEDEIEPASAIRQGQRPSADTQLDLIAAAARARPS